jgi:pimeloyl-ACP methyl ester carboxylesterase
MRSNAKLFALFLASLQLDSVTPWTASSFTSGSQTRHTNEVTTTVLKAKGRAYDVTVVPTFDEIGCTDYADAVPLIREIDVQVPENIAPSGSTTVTYIHWKANPNAPKKSPLPIMLIHGFDSSCLEFRRLGPKLAAEGVDVYAVDVLGFGFTGLEGVADFSANAKVTALEAFWKAVHERENDPDYTKGFAVAGASLGGAAAIELAASADAVKGMVLIDAQGFVDGVGPMASLPKPIAKLGVQLLQSVALRNSANQMSYFDKPAFATEDALKVGRLHTLRPGWNEAMCNYMASGGFSPSKKVAQCDMPSLVLWGRQDGILDGKEFGNKFVQELPNAELKWIEECGHVPHLEQPDLTARYISDFLNSEQFEGFREKSPGFDFGNLLSSLQGSLGKK